MNPRATARKYPTHPRREQGVVLFVGMVILLVMTLLTLSALRTTQLEERMSGGTLDQNVAFQAAEAALRTGEQALQVPVLPDFNNTGGRYTSLEFTSSGSLPRWKQWEGINETANWAANTIAYSGMTGAPGSLQQASARYYLEEFPLVFGPGESLAGDTPIDELGFYRVTARGVGASGITTVILQSTFKR